MSKDLNYYRMILKKVSFDSQLFDKELAKAYRNLDDDDRILLQHWLRVFANKNLHLNSSLES